MVKDNVQKAIDLQKDPSLTIFLAVEAVGKQVEALQKTVDEIEIPEATKPTDLTEINSKVDAIAAKQDEPLEIELQIV